MAILLGCGLRRAELTALRVEDIQQREEHWVIADLVGKGGHIRTIPIPDWVKAGIDVWMTAAGIKAGTLLRSINKAGWIWCNGFSPNDRATRVPSHPVWPKATCTLLITGNLRHRSTFDEPHGSQSVE